MPLRADSILSVTVEVVPAPASACPVCLMKHHRMTSLFVLQKRRAHAPPRRAFTLVELLVVIAIIGLLAGILIPVVGQVRKNTRAAADLANMRQLGIAMLGYAADHKGAVNIFTTLPSRDTWSNNYWLRAAPYLSSRLDGTNMGTPTVQALAGSLGNQTLPDEYQGTMFGIPRSLFFTTNKRLQATAASGSSSVPENWFRRLPAFPLPSTTPYIAVGKWGFVSGTPGPLPVPVPSEAVFWPYPGNKTIVVYLDGHVHFRGTEITADECWGGLR